MAKSKTKSTKSASKDMFVILWNATTDNEGNTSRITGASNVEASYTIFGSEQEAMKYIESEVSQENYTKGFYSIAKITRTFSTQFTLKEVA